MDDKNKYYDYLNNASIDLLNSLECPDLPFDLSGRKLQSVVITYIFDDYSIEVTHVEY